MGFFDIFKAKNYLSDVHRAKIFSGGEIATKYINNTKDSKVTPSLKKKVRDKLLASNMPDLEIQATLYHISADYDNSFRIYSQLPTMQSDSMYALAISYFYGKGTKKNYEKAFELWKQASIDGYSEAMFFLSLCYLAGHGTAVDLQKASYWEEKALEFNDPRAFYSKAVQNHVNSYTKQDVELTFMYLKKAGVYSLYPLGYMYKHGLGVDINHSEAFKLFKESSDAGDPRAMNEMLMYCASNDYGFKDINLALYWAKKLYPISLKESIFDSNKLYNGIKKLESM